MTDIVPTKDGSLTLHCHRYNQTYHSKFGAKTEALHVFLDGTGINQILRTHKKAHVLEIGFGTGLNFLFTAAFAYRYNATLHYTALEQSIPDAQTLKTLGYAELTNMQRLGTVLLDWRKCFHNHVPEGRYLLEPKSTCTLELLIGPATNALLPTNTFDAVYQDAFDPPNNPELWTSSFLEHVYLATHPGRRLATYSVAGSVRRRLTQVGFTVRRRPGPPGKRHCLVAIKPEPNSSYL